MSGFTGRLRDLFSKSSIFSWWGQRERTPPANAVNIRPGEVDMSGGLQANSPMLKGLYEGT